MALTPFTPGQLAPFSLCCTSGLGLECPPLAFFQVQLMGLCGWAVALPRERSWWSEHQPLEVGGRSGDSTCIGAKSARAKGDREVHRHHLQSPSQWTVVTLHLEGAGSCEHRAGPYGSPCWCPHQCCGSAVCLASGLGPTPALLDKVIPPGLFEMSLPLEVLQNTPRQRVSLSRAPEPSPHCLLCHCPPVTP